MTPQLSDDALTYKIGIDVGTNSIGFAAVEVDAAEAPVRILNSIVFRHDAGIDPGGNKTATTRLAASGVARRTRRRIKYRAKQLVEFDHYLESLGWPLIDLGEIKDPRAPWRIRARLAEEPITDKAHLHEALSIAVRHMARHRGWRSPYSRVNSLCTAMEPSDKLKDLAQRVSDRIAQPLPFTLTPGQIITAYIDEFETSKIRGPEGILGGTLHQGDYANELRKIGDVQGLSDELVRDLITRIFDAKSPKGAAAKRVAKDALPGQHGYRAEKAHPAFQLYRMVAIIANLRIREGSHERALTTTEREAVLDFLLSTGRGALPMWDEVADQLGIERHLLRGTASEGPDGLPPSTKPPVDMTDRYIMLSKHKKLVAWWEAADAEHRAALINAMSNAGNLGAPTEADDDVADFLATFDDAELESLDKVTLPAGRAAYSVDSLERLTRRMLNEGCDVHEARKREFGVDDSWTPPAEAINARVGNPAVDRVLKQVGRWLAAAERTWGAPLAINIEHVRDAFGSEKASRDYQAGLARRNRANMKIVEEMHAQLGLSGHVHESDRVRYLALQRQSCKCLYCGTEISFFNSEMDHIVSREGVASRNTRDNLAAVCRSCNHQKSNIPFAVWAAGSPREEVSLDGALERVRGFLADPGMSQKDLREFQKMVSARLKAKKPDEEFDGRSIESVAWMANELRHRIEQHFRQQGDDVQVRVYRGALTAEARKASGFEGRVNLIGGKGKTRLDRRHHAMDALTIAMMTPGIAQTLALRMNIRQAQRFAGEAETWKGFTGTHPASTEAWNVWVDQMVQLSDMFNLMLQEDAVPIMQNIRLRFGSSAVHEDTMKPFPKSSRFKVSDAMTVTDIDRASSPALWTALTRQPDYDPKTGLPENPNRQIRLHDRWLGPDDEILVFPTGAACLAVRGGYCEIGAGFHHARLYRIEGKKPSYAMLRVYQADLARYQNDDLFSVELPPSTISVRTAVPKLRAALADGTAKYIDWIVVGDELVIDPTAFTTGQIGTLLSEYPSTTHWEVAGFFAVSTLRLRPLVLSAEGIPEESSEDVKKILHGPGWLPSPNALFTASPVRVIRRDALGRERSSSAKNLPGSFTVE